MRLDRPAVLAGIASLAVALLPVQGLALVRAMDQQAVGASAEASASALVELPTAADEATADSAAPTAPSRQPEAAANQARRAQREGEESDPAYARFAEQWSAQANASQDVRQPDTTRWALLIGINEHLGSVRDNYGSRQDAEDLRTFLLSKGWRDDHIVLITDTDATRENILAGMTWLSRKTNGKSVAIFHYSGHSKKWYGQDHDGDGEVTDEGLWPTDDQFIADSEVAARLAGVDAGRFWISIGACNAEGFNDPGLARPGRILTFSSTEAEKSYEDPSVDNSVYGYYFFDEGLLQGFGDTNADGLLTVEESIAFAAPRATRRTEGQRYGTQNAVVVDQLEGDFDFEIPPPPAQDDEPAQQEQEPGLLCPVVCNRD